MMNKIKVTLSKDLRKKLGIRHFPISRGDMVKIVKGNRKEEGGKVASVDHRHGMVVIDGINIAKSDGKEKAFPIAPEKVVITKLDLTIPGREEMLKNMAASKNIQLSEEDIKETMVEPTPEPVEEVEAEEQSTEEEISEEYQEESGASMDEENEESEETIDEEEQNDNKE